MEYVLLLIGAMPGGGQQTSLLQLASARGTIIHQTCGLLQADRCLRGSAHSQLFAMSFSR
jgi:hypothetical protein